MLESLAIPAVLISTRELDQGGRLVMIRDIVANSPGIVEAQSLEEDMPEFLKFEVTIFVTVKARQAETLAQNVIFLEPAP
jgi:hypothetical protein